ncbi:anaerobic ribonucleoside-triphosphate reductase [Bacteroides sp.]|uniref:anaerobic ribonucleoside-triphosphate reductase n=1 Tax=Bacteroides sp. TaxID=29523 RepID=UPI0026120D9A|nr:anaerobic ribonucleoside-triphosphate reductase [Bacteroides sp.]MDD3041106.1 anaerobic ribonucleoside-triphosphate reductase [Bacteroides sp.]
MHYTETQTAIINRFKKPHISNLDKIPESEIPYWICSCGKILPSKNMTCPDCSATSPRPMCPLDTLDVPTTIEATLITCPLCNEFIHPGNGSHDVTVRSRVTGYLADVTNFNAGKLDELKNRQKNDF